MCEIYTYSNDKKRLEKINAETISKDQDEIFQQLEFIGKIERIFTNKFGEINKYYKNYNIKNQSEFISKNDIKNFTNEYNSFNKIMWLNNIKKHKPKTFQLLMDNQIKYYLHIQQVKKLYNEIKIIKKHKR